MIINVNIKIEKKGRKWFQVEDLNSAAITQLLIDDNTKDYEVDQVYAFAAELEDKRANKYGKVELIYVSESISAQEEQNNKNEALDDAKSEALDTFTYFVSCQYGNGNPENNKRKMFSLKAQVEKFELNDEDKAEITQAWQSCEERMTKEREYQKSLTEKSDHYAEQRAEKAQLVKDLRNSGNDVVAEEVALNLKVSDTYFYVLVANYRENYLTKAAKEETDPFKSENKLASELRSEGYKVEFVYYESIGNDVLHVNNIPFQEFGLNYMNSLTMSTILFDKETIKKYCKQKELLDELRAKEPELFEFDGNVNTCREIKGKAEFIVEFYSNKSEYVLKKFGGNYI